MPAPRVHRFSPEVRKRFSESSEALETFEQYVDEWRGRFNHARGMASYEQRRLVEFGVRTARRQIGHLLASTAIRVIDLASGVVVLVNENHAHAAFATARSLVETASVPAYIAKNVAPKLRKDRASAVEEGLRRLTMGIDPGVELRTPIEGPSGTPPVRVSQLVAALCTELERQVNEARSATNKVDANEGESPGTMMRQTYSLLSDHAHPNYSAVHLSAVLGEEGMDWMRAIDGDDLGLIVAATGLAMYGGGRAFDDVVRVANKHSLVLSRSRRG